MLVVTGAPRTGTSMMMQTLEILGVPVTGEKFSELNCHKAYNPKGYYELDAVEISEGIKDDRYKGKAIKLFQQGLRNTLEKHINKLIVCKRYPNDSIKSFYRLLQDSKVPIPKTMEMAALVVRQNAEIAKLYSENCGKPVLNMSFAKMTNDTEKAVNEICKFLKIKPSKYRKNKAVKNITGAK